MGEAYICGYTEVSYEEVLENNIEQIRLLGILTRSTIVEYLFGISDMGIGVEEGLY